MYSCVVCAFLKEPNAMPEFKPSALEWSYTTPERTSSLTQEYNTGISWAG